jgi:hypothetical protein
MNNKSFLINATKVIVALIASLGIVVLLLNNSSFSTVSPDSIRFMHFWQVNADHCLNNGGTLKDGIEAIYYSLKISSTYDLGRNRMVQYLLYGFDGLVKGPLNLYSTSLLIIIFVILNAALISWYATKSIQKNSERVTLFSLSWIILMTSIFTLSPILLLEVYAKYIWLTFILGFFLVHKKILKVIFLTLAAFSDEIGLMAVMLILFYGTVRWLLNYYLVTTKTEQTPLSNITKALFGGIVVSFSAFFIFYGIISVIFRVSPIAYTGGYHGYFFLEVTILKIFNFFKYSEMILFGNSICNNYITSNSYVTAFIGFMMGIAILLMLLKKTQPFRKNNKKTKLPYDTELYNLLNNEEKASLMFWIIMELILIIILPFTPEAGHYVYPPACILSIIFIMLLAKLMKTSYLKYLLTGVLALHLSLLTNTITKTSKSVEHHLLPLGTVAPEAINSIYQCINEFNAKGNSDLFKTVNNCQEIDFSGISYYFNNSNLPTEEAAKVLLRPYFPIEGTVRVLLWPKKIPDKCNTTTFNYRTPTIAKKLSISKPTTLNTGLIP